MSPQSSFTLQALSSAPSSFPPASSLASSWDTLQIDWGNLPDKIVAWVEMPGTSIDEPIVQARPDCLTRYLYVDVFGEDGYGTPYIDCDCSLEEPPLTVVYGHHMSYGSVFADFASCSYETRNSRTVVYATESDGVW